MRRRQVQFRSGLVGMLSVLVLLSSAAAASAQNGVSYTFTKVHVPGALYTEATGINSSGHVAGTFGDFQGFVHGFVYDGSTYTIIDRPGAAFTYVFGINGAGQLTGGYSLTDPRGPYLGFVYHNGTFTDFAFPDNETDGRAINNAGKIVGIYNAVFGAPDHGFLKDGGTYASLDYPGATKTYTFGLNDLDVVTGSYVDSLGALRGYWYFNGVYTGLNFPGADQTYVGGINNSHTITGWSQQGTKKTSYILRNLASFRSFVVPFAGATASQARAISDGGQVVGTYQSPGECFRSCGFLATVNPAGVSVCTQMLNLTYAPVTLNMHFTLSSSTPTTWASYVVVNGTTYPLWSVSLPALPSPVSVTVPVAVGPVGRLVALSTLSTASGGIMCADYAVINTSPGG